MRKKLQEHPMPGAERYEHPCGNCTHFKKSVWQPIAAGSVSVLARSFMRKELDEGDVLFKQGSESSDMFCVSKGLVSLRSYHPNGSSALLRLAYPGDLIGLRAFLKNEDHQTEARALVPSRVCYVARREANRVIGASPSILTRLIERCIDEIDQNRNWIRANAVLSNKERLADLLLSLLRHHGIKEETAVRMRLPLSRQCLADMLGVQPETLSRLMRRLESDGLISVSGRTIVVPSPKMLRNAAHSFT
jgi:CRP-like cAMP-binding protein